MPENTNTNTNTNETVKEKTILASKKEVINIIDIIDNKKSNEKLFGFSKDLTEEQKEFRKRKEDKINNMYKK